MLLYALIARSSDGCVLVEATSAGVQGNHTQITSQLLQKLTSNINVIPMGNRKTFTNNSRTEYFHGVHNDGIGGDVEMKSFWNNFETEEIYNVEEKEAQSGRNSRASGWTSSSNVPHYFHVQRGESVLYVALSDDSSLQHHRINFGFLMDVEKEFASRYTPNKILKANAYGMEKGFGKILNNMMHHCNTNRNMLGKDTKTAKLNAQVESIKTVLGMNIDLVMRREEHMRDLVDQSDDLLVDAKVFSKRGKKLKRAVKKKAWIYKLIIAGFAVLTIYLMMVKLCGFDLSCEDDSSRSGQNVYYDNGDDANGNDDGGGE
jgi:Synaptobrevin/VAMP-like protein